MKHLFFLICLGMVFLTSCSNDDFENNNPPQELRSTSINPLMGKWSKGDIDSKGNTTYDKIEFTENRFIEQIIGDYENGIFVKDKIAYQFNLGYTYVEGASYFLQASSFGGPAVKVYYAIEGDKLIMNPNTANATTFTRVAANPLMGKWSKETTDPKGNTTCDNVEFTENRYMEQIVGAYENGTFIQDKIAYQFNLGYTYVEGASYFLQASSFGGPANKVYYLVDGNKLTINPNTEFAETYIKKN